MAKSLRGKSLVDAYQRAGTNFLVYRLEPIFKIIKTDADRIRHNDAIDELHCMLGANAPHFLKMVASGILAKRNRKKNELIEFVAGKVIQSAFIPAQEQKNDKRS